MPRRAASSTRSTASRATPTASCCVERWESREALDQHLQTPHLLAFREGSADLWAEPMEILIVDPVAADDVTKGYLGSPA